MSALVPKQTAAELTQLLAASPTPDNALVCAYLQSLWNAAKGDRQLLYRLLPADFLASMASVISAGGEAALLKDIEQVKDRPVRRRLALLSSDPGPDASADGIASREIVAAGYQRQNLTFVESRDDQGRLFYATTEVMFGPLLFTGGDGAGTVTHVAAVMESDTTTLRVLAVWQLATPFQVHSGETVSLKAGTAQLGVG
ncbi:hypothetical protein [Streptomyces sp. UNOC14_S4]|uniref:phage tail fiber protein n=1 Tax=Streptomyces sp. UNOC14_S4 TaxID=2872340 RepID=UPI001E4D9CE1|nr:hypothetical protein [Streptomyces sp. UNOC14_S4]MCC3766047.1 hypothetical protein [Streptomyces sp. UNOC14_S4]